MRITIITACYNGSSVICTAIESVLRQTWKDIEYLVIDGGSQDGSVDQIRAYEPKFEGRMRWVSEPDQGLYDALNKGIRMATGDVIGFLNADDVLSSDEVVSRVAGAFGAKPEVEGVFGDIRFVANRVNVSVAELRREDTVRYYSAKHWSPWMLQWGYMPPHPSVYFRKACYERLGLYALDYKIAADYALLIRFLRKAGLCCQYLPMCFVDMRTGGVSTKNWRSNVLLNQEIVRGNREAGYTCCMAMLLPKYLFKFWEVVVPRIKGWRKAE